MSLRKSRRPTPLASGAAWRGNSCSKNWSNSSLRESSSRLRQYSRPRRSPIRWRNSLKSSGFESLISVVTGTARGQTLDVIGANEPRPDLILVVGDIAHVEDLVARADEGCRVPMALQAPPPRQRRILVRQRHPVDKAVARRAADAFVHVRAVVEVNEVVHAVDTLPDKQPA